MASFLVDQNPYIQAHQHSGRNPNSLGADLATIFEMANKDDDDTDLGVVLDVRPKTKRPPMYKVMILNDDYTPMEFVVMVLERFFGMNHQQSFELMLTVHKKGMAIVGVFSHEIAETKVTQVMDFARKHQHPLQCTMEKE